MTKITFIHTSDLHLGAPFRGLRAVAPEWAEKLMRSRVDSYRKIIDTAIDRSVDFVAIAGDVFDSTNASYSDYRLFFAGLRRLEEANIPVYLVHGNHDPYSSWRESLFELPGNVTVFSADKPDYALFEKDGAPACIVMGRSYYSKVWPQSVSIAEGLTRREAQGFLASKGEAGSDAPFCVGVIHTGLNLDPKKAPSDPKDLLARDVDYWALGHVHEPIVLPDETNPRLVFSGCIQARDVKEPGARGAMQVTLEQGAPNKVEFFPTADIAWERLTVNVSSCSRASEIPGLICRAMFDASGEAYCDELMARVRLTGVTPLHEELADRALLEELRAEANESFSQFFVESIADETRAPRDLEAIRCAGLFPAAVLSAEEKLRGSEADQLEYVSKEFEARGRSMPGRIRRKREYLLGKACDYVFDALAGGE